MSTDTKPRRVLVTGANKGIGFALVRAILEHDEDTLAYLGSRDRGRGTAAREELVEEHPEWAERVVMVQLDVAAEDSVAEAADAIAEHAGGEDAPLYGIVNNAGINTRDADLARVLEVNVYGPRRVFEHAHGLLDPERGRVVHMSSGSAPNFIETCDEELTARLTDPAITSAELDALMQEAIELDEAGEDIGEHGFGSGSAYGFSKACLNALTMIHARHHPQWTINSCTPGFIETDMTRPYAESRGVDPEEMGMKPPAEGTRAPMHLLFGEPGGSGWYFGSDAERSPMHEYRSPGDPPYTGEE